MGKTYRRSDGRRPKWDKRGNKSHKLRELEDEKFRHRTNLTPPPPIEPLELDVLDPLELL